MAQQLALLQGQPAATAGAMSAPAAATPAAAGTAPAADDEAALAHKSYDVKKAFGAIARIHTAGTEITERQRARLDAFMRRYIQKTRRSKEYTVKHRPHLADPRVVNGFRPQLKEIIYQLVIERSKGSHLWDLDGNEYVDALNGFGMSLFGWQPDFVLDAVRKQLDGGYDIGPQHPLAGEVAELMCKLTGFERAGLCNTGSEAVMGCVRIARTVTGRSKIAIFAGAYHGIFDEVIVRGTKKLKSVPAAPGILPNTAENVIVLDYGTPETLLWLKENAKDLAAILVEPVQSRRPDFQPKEFLRELRTLTEASGALLIFDEVVTGFRSHPGGIQALFGIRADLASYGKVVGGGFPIGVIAGKREYMDALDGGHWEYGDDSIPTVGVTYFAGTFVRHPLALVAAKAVLEHLEREGPELQATLTRSTAAMVDELNAFCREVGAPIVLKHFSSVWKIFFSEDHPLQDLLFAMMRNRGVHILDNFPCFMTTAHTAQDIAVIKTAFKEAVAELQEADFIPKRGSGAAVAFDASRPPVPGARLGRDAEGKPAWFVANAQSPGKYIKVDVQ
jgi:glutamate-1-semialdehyde aminotransferase